MSSLAFEHVWKRFGDVVALNDLTLASDAGEFLVLVGPSGCGKSTALRILAGLDEPSQGAVLLGGRDVTPVEPRDRDIAMVFQNYALYPHMSVRDNLAFGLRQRKQSGQEITSRIDEAAAILEIGHLLDRRPRELSGGQRQRVALGRAIVRRPAVFLMDEPLSNLDAQLRGRTRVELAALHRRLATTFVYVTHDQTEAMTMGSRVAVLKDGVLLQADRPREIYERPVNTFVATFMGTPAMNLIPGSIQQRGESMQFVAGDAAITLPAGTRTRPGQDASSVTLGLRPEAFSRTPEPYSPGTFGGPIVAVEPLGSDLFVTIDFHGERITARLDPALSLSPGDSISLNPVVGVPLLFDQAGDRIDQGR